MIDIQKKFGQKVRKLRLTRGLSQEQLSFKSKLHRTYISDIERGTRNVSIKNIQKIACALGITPVELLDYN